MTCCDFCSLVRWLVVPSEGGNVAQQQTYRHAHTLSPAPLMELLAIRLSTIKPCKSLVIPPAGEGSCTTGFIIQGGRFAMPVTLASLMPCLPLLRQFPSLLNLFLTHFISQLLQLFSGLFITCLRGQVQPFVRLHPVDRPPHSLGVHRP